MKLEINGHTIETDEYVKKWTDWALAATPATDEEVKTNVVALYKLANLPAPDVRVYRDYDEFITFDWPSVGASVRASVRDSVRANVWANVGASVWASVRASVRANVGASVRANGRDSVWDSVGAWCWADDLSFADVFVAIDVLSKAKAQELYEFKRLLETQRLAVLTPDVAYVLVAPAIHRDTAGNLHNDRGRSVDWGKSGLYHLHGVSFEKTLWEKVTSRKMPFADILAIPDIDQRKQAMKYGNVWEFVKHCNAKEIDTYTKTGLDGRSIRYWLYEFPATDAMFPNGAMYAIYEDSMLGAAEIHMQGVPMDCKTVPQAFAWKQSDDLYTLTPKEWEALELDVHFS